MILRRVSLTGAALLAFALPAFAQDDAWVLEVGHLLTRADAEPVVGGKLLIVGGKIKASGATVDAPEGARVVRRPDAWVVPALVDPSNSLGLVGERDDLSDPIQGDVSVAWRLNPRHPDFEAARAAGVGTCLVVPGEGNLFGGEGLVLRTDGVTRPDSQAVAKLALGASVLRTDRPPTSRVGAVALLRRTIEERQGAAEGPRDGLSRFATGATQGIIAVGESRDLLAAIALTEPYGVRLIYQLPSGFEPLDVEGLALAGRGFLVGPYGAGSPTRALKLPAALARLEGVTFAFRSAAPFAPMAGLRGQAVLAVAHGLAPRRALHALTQGAADLLGVGDRVGSLEPGKEADLLVLSGPPLDVRSRVLELYLAGARRYTRPAQTGGDQ